MDTGTERRKRQAGRASSGGADPERGSEQNVAWEWTKSILWAIVLFLVIRTFIAQSFYISSASMEDTLLVGDVLMVSRAAYGAKIPGTALRLPGYDSPSRDEIVIFRPEHDPDTDVVKRLVGMPGDTLEMRERRLFINGEPRPEPYAGHDPNSPNETHPWMVWQYSHLLSRVDAEAYTPSRDDWGPLVVPPDRYFVMGDNRERSLDSRYWGFLERDRLEGKVSFLYYSFDPASPRPLPVIFAMRPGRIGLSPGD